MPRVVEAQVFQCRSCADFKVAVTIVHWAEAERTWVIMQGETPQAGNRARKSFRRHQWSDHAGELGLGSLCHLCVWDGHAKPFLHPGIWPTRRFESFRMFYHSLVLFCYRVFNLHNYLFVRNEFNCANRRGSPKGNSLTAFTYAQL